MSEEVTNMAVNAENEAADGADTTASVASEAAEAVTGTTGRKKTAKAKTAAGIAPEALSGTGGKNAAAKKHAYMYLGPNIPGGILFTGSVYKEIPKHVSGIFEKLPAVKELFIEVREAAAFKRELQRLGSEASRLYRNVITLINEGALKDDRI